MKHGRVIQIHFTINAQHLRNKHHCYQAKSWKMSCLFRRHRHHNALKLQNGRQEIFRYHRHGKATQNNMAHLDIQEKREFT